MGTGHPSRATRNHLVANSDIAQTIAELAQAPVPAFVDGRSLVPLLNSNPTPLAQWRQAILLAYQQHLFTPWPAVGNTWPPDYFGLLSNIEKYVYYDTGEQEYYRHNVDVDPYEMESHHSNAFWKDRMRQLQRWAQAFGKCFGENCRQLDRAPPQ